MNELMQIPSGDATRVGLILPEGLGINDWKRIGHQLFKCRESLWFWIGDWINYGEANYGDKYKEAKKVFGEESSEYGGYDEATLRKAASIANRVPLVLRRTSLTFGHHAVVAPLESKEQKRWLKEAEEKKLTVRQLTEQVRGNLKDRASEGVNSTADVFMFERWINEAVRGFKSFPVSEWEDDVLSRRIQTLAEIEKPLLDEAEKRNLPLVERVKAAEAA